MNNREVVDIVVLIDKSFSMGGMIDETIGAFNGFLKEQREIEGEALLTLILFDHECEAPYFQVPLDFVEDLTRETYQVRGNTAMYDAIGLAIDVMELANKSEKVIFLIQSDGQENSSTLYSGDLLARRIKAQEKLGWDFKFIGTGIDAIKEGSKFGLRTNSCTTFDMSGEGIHDGFASMDVSATAYRTKSVGSK